VALYIRKRKYAPERRNSADSLLPSVIRVAPSPVAESSHAASIRNQNQNQRWVDVPPTLKPIGGSVIETVLFTKRKMPPMGFSGRNIEAAAGWSFVKRPQPPIGTRGGRPTSIVISRQNQVRPGIARPFPPTSSPIQSVMPNLDIKGLKAEKEARARERSPQGTNLVSPLHEEVLAVAISQFIREHFSLFNDLNFEHLNAGMCKVNGMRIDVKLKENGLRVGDVGLDEFIQSYKSKMRNAKMARRSASQIPGTLDLLEEANELGLA